MSFFLKKVIRSSPLSSKSFFFNRYITVCSKVAPSLKPYAVFGFLMVDRDIPIPIIGLKTAYIYVYLMEVFDDPLLHVFTVSTISFSSKGAYRDSKNSLIYSTFQKSFPLVWDSKNYLKES
jgi:hypothetical protein